MCWDIHVLSVTFSLISFPYKKYGCLFHYPIDGPSRIAIILAMVVACVCARSISTFTAWDLPAISRGHEMEYMQYGHYFYNYAHKPFIYKKSLTALVIILIYKLLDSTEILD